MADALGLGSANFLDWLAINPSTNMVYATQPYGVLAFDGNTDTLVAKVWSPLGENLVVNVATNSVYRPCFDDSHQNPKLLVLDGGDIADFYTIPLAKFTTVVDINPESGDLWGVGIDSFGLRELYLSLLINGNSAPTIDEILTPVDPTNIATQVAISATFTDPDSGDQHTASWSWGEGTTSQGDVDDSTGAATGSHMYESPGIYTVSLTIVDSFGLSDTDVAATYVVVYDPNGGFVTGGGWIGSPAGAYVGDQSLTGKATFGFVAKYQKGATVPNGNTEFQFRVADLNFHSTSYQWLLVNQAGKNAQFKGDGTINGASAPNGHDYKFMIWAGDGSPDTFRIKIWWEDTAGEHVVYDNGVLQAVAGGSIVVHTK
jgi:hypothetical protein